MSYHTITLTPKYLFAVIHPATASNTEYHENIVSQGITVPTIGTYRLYDDTELFTLPQGGWNASDDFILVRYTVHRPLKLLLTDRTRYVIPEKRKELIEELNLDGEVIDYNGSDLIDPCNAYRFLGEYDIMETLPKDGTHKVCPDLTRSICVNNVNLQLCKGDSEYRPMEKPFDDSRRTKMVVYTVWIEYLRKVEEMLA